MKIRNISLSFVLLAVAIVATGCATVKPGTVGVAVNNWGQDRGVEDYPIRTGVVLYNPLTSDVHVFPVSVQTVKWTLDKSENDGDRSITFNSGVDRVSVNADVGASVTFVRDKVPHIFVKYRKDPNDLIDGVIRNEVRSTMNRLAATYSAAEIVATKSGEFLDAVKNALNAHFKEDGFYFESVSFLSRPRIPANIEQAINEANAAAQYAQKAQYLVQVKKAEADQAIESARGQAESIKIQADAQAYAQAKIAASTTPLIVELKKIEKWNGSLPQVSGGGTPFVNLSTK